MSQPELFAKPITHDAGAKAKPPWPAGSLIAATFAGDVDCYRLSLSEVWNPAQPLIMWLMMNPSVATVTHADRTLLKTGKFSRLWGFGGQIVGNVHAYRATDAKRLLTVADPVGPGNDAALLQMARRTKVTILAYGQPPKPLRARAASVVQMLDEAGIATAYLRLAKDGTPCHPLYLPGDLHFIYRAIGKP